MRDPKRIHEICCMIEELWNKTPDQRFWQLMSNTYHGTFDPFYYEDDKWIEDLQKTLDKFKKV